MSQKAKKKIHKYAIKKTVKKKKSNEQKPKQNKTSYGLKTLSLQIGYKPKRVSLKA